VGTNVTINGTNFLGASSVAFHGTGAAFSVNGAGTQISTTVPTGATTGQITVSTPNGTATTSNFTVTGTAPSITNFAPRNGPVGTPVTITGLRFGGATAVTFNGTSAPFSVNGAGTQITTTVPSGATTGKVSVTSAAGTDQSFGNFTVTGTGAPNVTGFSPNSGKVGTSVSIFGSGFSGTTAVRFNGTAAAPFTVVTSGKITTTVSTGATTGKISVTNAAGTATSGSDFTVTGLKITGFSPTSGNVGTIVTLLGSGFTGVSSVRFNGTAAAFTFVNDGRVTASVPGGATSGGITLTTPSGTATTGTFTVTGGVHDRSITFSVVHGRSVSGHVSANDGYSACASNVPVVIKRFRGGAWRWVITTSTRQDGNFRAKLSVRRGTYRAKAKKIRLVNGVVCAGARSGTVHP
jgi:IPT/TIG domain.